jgi:ferritin
MKSKDFMTFQFLQWFLQEQVEEEYVARRALELFDVIGEEGTGRWEIDKNVRKIKYDNGADGGE